MGGSRVGPTRVYGVWGSHSTPYWGPRLGSGGPTRVFGVPMSPVGPIGSHIGDGAVTSGAHPCLWGAGGPHWVPLCPILGVWGGSWGSHSSFSDADVTRGSHWVPYRGWGGHEWGPPVFMGCGGPHWVPYLGSVGVPLEFLGCRCHPWVPMGSHMGWGGHEWGPITP